MILIINVFGRERCNTSFPVGLLGCYGCFTEVDIKTKKKKRLSDLYDQKSTFILKEILGQFLKLQCMNVT